MRVHTFEYIVGITWDFESQILGFQVYILSVQVHRHTHIHIFQFTCIILSNFHLSISAASVLQTKKQRNREVS